MKTCITLREFVALPAPVREQLRHVFRIGKSGPMEIVNGEIVSDGSTAADIQRLDIGALIAFLGTASGIDTDGLFDRLFSKVLDKLTYNTVNSSPAAVPVDAGLVDVSNTNPVVPSAPVSHETFCDSCDSKGKRHKKVCPKNNK